MSAPDTGVRVDVVGMAPARRGSTTEAPVMLKTILAPVSGAARDTLTLAAAMSVARDFDAHVDALFVRMPASASVPIMGEGVSGAVIEQLMNAAEEEWSRREQAGRSRHHCCFPGHGAFTPMLKCTGFREKALPARWRSWLSGAPTSRRSSCSTPSPGPGLF